METETIDKLFLELSQFTNAQTAKEISLETARRDALNFTESARRTLKIALEYQPNNKHIEIALAQLDNAVNAYKT